MKLFLNTFINKVDKKGRVSIPAAFRTAVSHQDFQGVVLYPSFSTSPSCLEGCGTDHMEKLASAAYDLDAFSTEQEDLTALIFSNANQLSFDSTGRIVLPESLMTHAGITDSVAFLGKGKTFQIWEPKALEKAQKEARERIVKSRTTLPLRKNGGEK
ncbi:MAG: division/cell wall cluster transcriptional repressor MraZ [Alphaproteobacteria bacterium]|nr:division/cell wall cluster transcriptional repressor MraZ [Alphaproteobacteria bacterium]